MRAGVGLALTLALLPGAVLAETQWSGWTSLEGRAFPLEPLHEGQHGSNLSIAARPELYQDWRGGAHSFTLSVFGPCGSG